MKKILFLLLILVPLMAISQTIPADATALENLQITNNTTSPTAPFVTVQETNGVMNKINKADLVNVVEVNDVPSLPLIGEVGKIYVVKNVNKIYRWNGTFYQGLAVTDITYQSIIDALGYAPDNVANKATDFSIVNNTLYPSVQAVKGQFDSYFSNILKDIVFPPLYLPSGTLDFEAKTVLKGNANSNLSGHKIAVAVTDDLDRVVGQFDNSGRLDLKDYSGQGAITCLYNMAPGAINNLSHYAMAARNSSGNLNTVNSIVSIVTDPTDSAMSSELKLQFMQDVNTTSGYQQPNKAIRLNKTGVHIPALPIVSDTGIQDFEFTNPNVTGTAPYYLLTNPNPGSAPAGIKYFANNSVERGTIELSINPNSPFEADLIYKTKGYLGTPETTRFKIDGHTGEVTASSYTGGANLINAPTAPTAALGTNTTQIATTAFVQAVARPYKVYTALLSQSGTNAPVATVLENTLGGTVVWGRNSAGEYRGTLNGAFVNNKTTINISSGINTSSYSRTCDVISSNEVNISTLQGGVYTDGLMGNYSTNIEIRVYN